MYQHDPDADLVQDANLLHERAGSAGVGEDFAPSLDHEHFALEKPNVGRGVL
jgi:hypothetical protein